MKNIILNKHNINKLLFVFIFTLLYITTAPGVYSAGKTWTFNGSGNWSDADKWSPAVIPGTDDAVVIDTPGVVVTLDSTRTISTFSIGSTKSCTLFLHSGSLTIKNDTTIGTSGFIGANAYNLTLKGSFNISTRTTNPFIPPSSGTPSIKFQNTTSTTYIPALNIPGWNINMDSSEAKAQMSGNITCKDFSVTNASTFGLSSYVLNCKGNILLNWSPVILKGTGKIILSKGSTVNFDIANDNYNSDLGNIEITEAGTIVNKISNSMLKITSLTVGSGCEFRDLVAGSTILMSCDSTGITVNGKFTLKECSLVKTSGNFALSVNGSGIVSLTSTAIKNCSPVNSIIDASNNCNNLGGNDPNLKFDPYYTSIKTWLGGSGNWADSSKWSDNIAPDGNSDVYINSGTVNNVSGYAGSLTLSNCSVTLTGDLTINHYLTVGSSVNINSGSSALVIKKNVSNTSMIAGAGDLRMIGEIPQTISWSAKSWNIQDSNISGYMVSMADVITCANFTLDSGSDFSAGYNMTINGDASITGNFNKYAGCTVFFDSGKLQSVYTNNRYLGNVKLNTPGTILSLISNVNFDNLEIASGTVFKDVNPGTQISFPSSGGNILLNGTLELKGTTWGNDVYLYGNSARFEKGSSGVITWEYVRIKGCSAVSYIDISGSTVNNYGENKNFKFPARSWTGASSTSWGTDLNWYPPYHPDNDNVIINKSYQEIYSISGTINSLTISGTSGSTIGLLSGTLTITDVLTIASLSQLYTTATLNVAGNIEALGELNVYGSLVLNGTSNQNLKCSGTPNISINNAVGAVVTLMNSDTLSCTNFSVSPTSTFNPNNKKIAAKGDVLIDGNLSGILNALSINSGSSSSVNYKLKTNNNHLGNIRIESANTTVSLLSSIRFSSLNIISSGSRFIDITPGTTITVDNTGGITLADAITFLLSGTGSNYISLTSDNSSQFDLVLSGTPTVNMVYSNISNCNANVAVKVSPSCNISNSVNIVKDALTYSKTWVGDGANYWGNPGCWNPMGVPDLIHDVIITTGTPMYNIGPSQIASFNFTNNGILNFSTVLIVNGGFYTNTNCTLNGGGTIIVKGPVNILGVVTGTAAFEYAGNSPQAASWSGNTNWSVTINNPSLVTLSADFTCKNFIVSAGAYFKQGEYNLSITGNSTVNGNCTLGNGNTLLTGNIAVSGILSQSGSGSLSVGGSFTVDYPAKFFQGSGDSYLSGNFTLNNTGTSSFTKGLGRLIFNKGGTQILNFNKVYDMGNLKVTKTNTVAQLDSSIQFTNLTIDSNCVFRSSISGKTITVSDGGAITVDSSSASFSLVGVILTTYSSATGVAGFTLKTDPNMQNVALSNMGIRNCSPVYGLVNAMNNCENIGGNDETGNDVDRIYFNAVSKTWNNSTGNMDWNNSTNWSPATAFPPSSVNNLVVNLSSTAITNIKGMINSLAINTLNPSLTLSGNLTINSGFGVSVGSGTVNITSNNYTLMIKGNVNALSALGNSGNIQILPSSQNPNLIFNGPAWNIQNSNGSSTVNISGGVTCRDLIIDSGAGLNANNYDIAINGNAGLTGAFTPGTGGIIFKGGAIQTLYSSDNNNLGNIRLNGANTVLSLLSNLTLNRLTVNSGSYFRDFTLGTTITLVDISTGGGEYGGGIISGSVTVNGSLTMAGTSWGVSSISFMRSASSGAFTLSKASGGTVSLTYVNIKGCSVVSNPLNFASGKVNNLGNNSNIIFPPRSWIYQGTSGWGSADKWDPPAVPDVLDDVKIDIPSYIGNTNLIEINSLTIGNTNFCTLDCASGNFTIYGSSGLSVGTKGTLAGYVRLNIKGNVYCANSGLTLDNLYLYGNTNQTIKWPGNVSTIDINNTGGTVVFNNTTETLGINTIQTVSGSTVQINSQQVKISLKAEFLGTVLSNNSTTMIFKSDNTIPLNASGSNMGNITLKGSAVLDLKDSLKCYSLFVDDNTAFHCLYPGITITVVPPSDGAGITVSTLGKFYFAGSYDNRNVLKSSTTAPFIFTLEEGKARFAYTDISYCDASGGATVYITNNSSKNNTQKIEFSDTINSITWNGGNGDWTVTAKWNPNDSIPLSFNDVFVPADSAINSVSGDIASITLTGSASLSLGVFGLNVNGNCIIADGSTISGGGLFVKGNLEGKDISGAGILYLAGKTFQSVSWQAKTWDIEVSNASSAGISAVSDIVCNNFTLKNNDVYFQGNSNLSVFGNMKQENGSSFIQSSDGRVSVNGNLDIQTGSSSIFGKNLSVIGSLTTAGTCALGSDYNYVSGNFTENGGSFNMNIGQFNIDGNMTINSGSFNQGDGHLSVRGDVDLKSTFNHGDGSITFMGSSVNITSGIFHNNGKGILYLFAIDGIQNLNPYGNNLGKVKVDSYLSDKSTINLINNAEFTSLNIQSGASLICSTDDRIIKLGETAVDGTFDISGSRITLSVQPKPDKGINVFSSGKFNLTGKKGITNYVSLLSRENGKNFSLTTPSVNNVSVKYANIQDCDASAGDRIEAAYSVDLGNNLNIYFGSNPPSAINDLKIRQVAGSGEVKLSWTAVGTEWKKGRATSYIIKYNNSCITSDEQFDSSNIYAQEWSPLESGKAEEYILKGLQGSDIFYVSVEAINFAGLQGDLSEITEFTVVVDPSKPLSYKIPGKRGNVNIEIPAGAFSQSVEIMGREQTEKEMPAVSNQPEFKSTGVGALFTITPVEKFKKPLKLTMKYEAKDVEGLKEDKLKIAFYNDTMGKWYHLKSKADLTKKSVSAELSHLTMFRIVEYTYLGLSTVKIFPNPWKIGKGNNFDSDTLTFKNLPERGRIRLYNVAGEMVKNIDITETDDGFYSWDGKNEAGNKVSSGIYIAYVEDNEGHNRIMKVGVIR